MEGGGGVFTTYEYEAGVVCGPRPRSRGWCWAWAQAKVKGLVWGVGPGQGQEAAVGCGLMEQTREGKSTVG